MVHHTGQPAYLQIADDLRAQIHAGRMAPGDPLPSTARLAEQYGSSASVIKMAVGLLRTEGLVVGQQGKGVFVCDSAEAVGPADALDVIRAELRELSDRVAQVEKELAASKKRPGGRSSH